MLGTVFPMNMTADEINSVIENLNRVIRINKDIKRREKEQKCKGQNPCDEMPLGIHELKRGFTPPTKPAQPQVLKYEDERNFDETEYLTPMYLARLQEVERLYSERMIITTRHKVEYELKYFFNTLRKSSYIPYMDDEEAKICERIDKAIDFLLTLSRKIDRIQQAEKIYSNTQHIEILQELH